MTVAFAYLASRATSALHRTAKNVATRVRCKATLSRLVAAPRKAAGARTSNVATEPRLDVGHTL